MRGVPIGLLMVASLMTAPAVAGDVHGLWIWDGPGLVKSPAQQQKLVAAIPELELTDIYVALPSGNYASLKGLPAFIRLMSQNGVKVWGLDGCRCYFKDAGGPMPLYQNVAAMMRYNKTAPEEARFTGFQTDNEPQDLPDYPKHFHNGLATSKLSPAQKAERDDLLRNWLDIQQTVYALLKEDHLRAGAAMVFFTEDYQGEPLKIDYNGVTANVGHLMMGYTDDYVVMSYNTDPENAAGRVAGQAAFASQLPADVRPRILAAMETNPGVEAHVSYGDTPSKATKAQVLADRAALADRLRLYPAFAGVSLHAWSGWQALPDK